MTIPSNAEEQENTDELNSLLEEGLNAPSMTEDEFWDSVKRQTNALLAEHRKTQ